MGDVWLDNPGTQPGGIEEPGPTAALRERTRLRSAAGFSLERVVAASQQSALSSGRSPDIQTLSYFDESRAVEWFAAMDYGFAHYTVFLLGCTDGDGNIFVVDEHAQRLWIPQRHAVAIKAMLARHNVHLPGSATRPLPLDNIVEDNQLIGWRYTGLGAQAPLASQVFLPEEVWFEKLPNPFDPAETTALSQPADDAFADTPFRDFSIRASATQEPGIGFLPR